MMKPVIVLFVLTVGAAIAVEDRQRVFFSCDQIRQAVATHGLSAVEQFARTHGVSETDLRRARLKCLQS